MLEKQALTQIDGIIIYRNFVENLPYNRHLKPLTKEKRKLGILSEVLFWKQVRNKNFHNIDFDRQRIIGSYIVDFFVKALGLVVEIDGISHDFKQDYDMERTKFLESLGLKIFRITDFDVKQNLSLAMNDLENFIIEHYSS
ncbi:endonuclease domain-containing protein [Chryseobacterium taeanense]|uniref:endonuclease domain-containing protein n=1 Tax=Chryseobacterium taeanense TaxID=311334 RepID=UPI0035B1C860